MSTCKGCGETIDWVRTKDGRYMPVEPEPVFIVEGDGFGYYVTDEGESLPDAAPSCRSKTYFAKQLLSHIGRTARKPDIFGAAYEYMQACKFKAKRDEERKAKGQMSVF